MTDEASWAEDWRTIWQSELAALAVDREAHEAVGRLAAHWAGLPTASPPDGAARPNAPARPPAVAAPPGDGDAAGLAKLAGLAELVQRLERRVAELERLARA